MKGLTRMILSSAPVANIAPLGEKQTERMYKSPSGFVAGSSRWQTWWPEVTS